MMVKLINPTSNDIRVSIEGVDYLLEGKGTIEIEEGHAEYWKSKLHNFLIVEAGEVKTKEEKEEPKEEPKEEVKEEKEEEKEEEPKKGKGKK